MSDQQYYAWLASAANAAQVPLKEAFEAGYLAGRSSVEQRIAELERERDELKATLDGLFSSNGVASLTELAALKAQAGETNGGTYELPDWNITPSTHAAEPDEYERGYRDGCNDAADTVCQHNITLTEDQIEKVEGAIRRMTERVVPAAERPDHRKVMQMALEVLLDINEISKPPMGIALPAEIDGAIDRLREALKGEA